MCPNNSHIQIHYQIFTADVFPDSCVHLMYFLILVLAAAHHRYDWFAMSGSYKSMACVMTIEKLRILAISKTFLM